MKPRILLIDDDPEFAQLIQFNLESHGCEVTVARDGMEGLRLARIDSPDLILLDLMLPDLDGLVVCEILQAQPSTRDIPVFILSALDQSWTHTRKNRAKFARYFVKPPDLKLLITSAVSTCQQRQVTNSSRLSQSGD